MTRSHARTRLVALVVVLLATVCVACSGDDGDARVASPDARLTGAEWDYGASINRDSPGVTFQPDVVIPGGGAASVVGVSGDGITWTLKGDAAEVGDLAPGKLLLVTNRGAGRVLAVDRHEDGNVAVTIGPAELTDFIQEIDTRWEGDVDPSLFQVRVAPTLPSSADVTNHEGDTAEGDAGGDEGGTTGTTEPGATEPDEGTATTEPDGDPGGDGDPKATTTETTETTDSSLPDAGGPSGFAPPTGVLGAIRPVAMSGPLLPSLAQDGQVSERGDLPPVAQEALPVVPVEGMKVHPLHGSDGSWGVEVRYDKNGLKVVGSARLYLQAPKIGFDLVIKGGKIVTAEASLSGLAGVRANFDAGTEKGLQANIHQIVDLPVDLNIPLFGPTLPFAINFHQSFKIDTVFSAKNSTLSFTGDYGFGGTLKAGYRDGSFGIAAPSGLSVRRSLLQTTNGVSVGVNGFIIAHKLRMTIGIGGFGFAVGPYVALTTAMSVVNGSDLGIVKCKGATLNLDMGYGIGYVMPTAVVKVINVFLRALNVGEIKPTGGIGPINSHLATLAGYAPKKKICEGAV